MDSNRDDLYSIGRKLAMAYGYAGEDASEFARRLRGNTPAELTDDAERLARGLGWNGYRRELRSTDPVPESTNRESDLDPAAREFRDLFERSISHGQTSLFRALGWEDDPNEYFEQRGRPPEYQNVTTRAVDPSQGHGGILEKPQVEFQRLVYDVVGKYDPSRVKAGVRAGNVPYSSPTAYLDPNSEEFKRIIRERDLNMTTE